MARPAAFASAAPVPRTRLQRYYLYQVKPDEIRPSRYAAEFVFRSIWNVAGLVAGGVLAVVLWRTIEPIQTRILCSAAAFILLFFGGLAIGIRKEYRQEDEEH